MQKHVNVVFDLDGTLIDSAPIVEGILNEMRGDSGLCPLSREQSLPLLSIGGESMLQCALETDLKGATTALEHFRAEYFRRSTPCHLVYPGVTEVLKTLSDAKVALSVCTNKPRSLAIKSMEETGLLGYFSKVCAGDDLPTKKPDPANLKASIVPFDDLQNSVYLVGDSTVDQQLAENVGVPFIFFSEGYNDGVDKSRVYKHFSNYEGFPSPLFISANNEKV